MLESPESPQSMINTPLSLLTPVLPHTCVTTVHFFSTYEHSSPPKCIWVADNCAIEAIGISDIEVEILWQDQVCLATLKGVLYLPSLSKSVTDCTGHQLMPGHC